MKDLRCMNIDELKLDPVSLQPNDAIENILGLWWRHQMETFSVLLAISAGNSPVPGEFPTQRSVTRSFDGVGFKLHLHDIFKGNLVSVWFELFGMDDTVWKI